MERKVQNPHKTVPTVHGGGVHPAALLEASRRTETFSGDILATQPGSYRDSFPARPRAAPCPKKPLPAGKNTPVLCQHKDFGGGTNMMKIIPVLNPLHQIFVPGEQRFRFFEMFHTLLAVPVVSHMKCSFTATPEHQRLMLNEQIPPE